MVNLLTEHLDIWATAQTPKAKGGRGRGKKSNQSPHGIKKLRELILELAVRGKLVPQDPNDEPASVLLEKIAQEKTRLIKEGKIKKQKTLPEISEDEKPFGLPVGWEICHFGVLVNSILSGGTPSKRNPEFWDGDIPWASVKDLGKSKYLEETMDHITQKGLDAGSKLAEINDVIICTRMGLGKIAIAKARIAINQDLKAVKFTSQLNLDYFLIFFATLNIKGTGTTVAGIKQEELLNYFFPLPPLAEQCRIVAKVNELMALCDQLEQQQTDSNTTHQTLLETLLATLTNAADQEGFAKAWQRIANHFDTLFTTEQSIDQLKQTILQLAVMGKLVPQNPNDEPASVLLKKIAKEKARLIEEGEIKKQKPLLEVTEEEKLFELPNGWEWERLGNLSVLKGGFAYKSSVFSDEGKNQVIRMGNIRPDCFRLDEKPAYISTDLAEETLEYQIELNNILITMTGTKGKRDYLYSLIVRPEHLKARNLYLNQRLCIIRGLLLVHEFLGTVIKDDRLLDAIYVQSTGTANQANIGMVSISNWVLPLPPIEEQHRIVAKVDELMALCDTLKARLSDAQTTQAQLADTIVEQPSVATLTKEKRKQKKKPDEEDVQFIFDDVLKFSIMDFEDYKTHLVTYPEDKLHHINLPEPGFGLFHISYESSERFHALTRRLMKSKSNEIHRCDIDESALDQSIRDTFAQFFILDRKPIEQKFVDRMLNRALRTTRINHATITHYLPCVIVSKNDPKEFCLGVVRFIQTDKFFEEYDVQIETDLESQSREKRKKAVELIDQGKLAGPITSEKEWELNREKTFVWIHEYYEHYDWIAEVTVPPSDPKVSRRRAELVVQASIDFLKAVFGSYGASSIRLGHNPASPNKTASLIRPDDGQFEWSISHSSNNGVYVEDNWFEHMWLHYGAFLDVGSEVIQTLLSPDQATELCERWLDALNWYGQAVSEPLPSAQIVKYTAALERLTITQKTPPDSDQGVTESVTRRTAILSVGDQQEFFEIIRKDAREVYAWRSELMHGRSSPSSKDEFVENEMRTVQSKADKLTRDALFGALIDYRKLLIGRKTDSKDLEEWFQKHEGQRL